MSEQPKLNAITATVNHDGVSGLRKRDHQMSLASIKGYPVFRDRHPLRGQPFRVKVGGLGVAPQLDPGIYRVILVEPMRRGADFTRLGISLAAEHDLLDRRRDRGRVPGGGLGKDGFSHWHRRAFRAFLAGRHIARGGGGLAAARACQQAEHK